MSIEAMKQEPVTLETVYETIIHWDEGGGKRSRRELARRIVALYAAAVHEPAARMQPIVKDPYGVLRFKENKLVSTLYAHGVATGLGLNELHCMPFTDEDRRQFAQLIGYSVDGYGTLTYVDDEACDLADEAARAIGEQQ